MARTIGNRVAALLNMNTNLICENILISFNLITKNAMIGDNVRRFVEEYRDGFHSTRASARINIHELSNANDSC